MFEIADDHGPASFVGGVMAARAGINDARIGMAAGATERLAVSRAPGDSGNSGNFSAAQHGTNEYFAAKPPDRYMDDSLAKGEVSVQPIAVQISALDSHGLTMPKFLFKRLQPTEKSPEFPESPAACTAKHYFPLAPGVRRRSDAAAR